jgi:hypothetical protein
MRPLSIAGELIDDLARLIPDHDDRSGFSGSAILQKVIYYWASDPNSGLVGWQHHTARVAHYPIWVDQCEEIARHHQDLAPPKKKRAPTDDSSAEAQVDHD